MGGSNSFAIKILGFWVISNKQPFIQKRLDCKITSMMVELANRQKSKGE
jgi:hypothetical protein